MKNDFTRSTFEWRAFNNVLLLLYRKSKIATIPGKVSTIKISLAPLINPDPEQDRAMKQTLEALEQLKVEGVVKSYTQPKSLYVNTGKPNDTDAIHEICMPLKCSFYPSKVIEYFEPIQKHQLELVKNTLTFYRQLMKLLMLHFKKPTVNYGDDVEDIHKKSNELYKATVKEVSHLFSKIDTTFSSNESYFQLYFPFKSLFSAPNEIRKRKADLHSEISKMVDCYDKLLDLQNNLNLHKNTASTLLSKEINEHVSYLESIRESTSIKTPSDSLLNQKMRFDDNEAILFIGKNKCQLPPYKNEHFLCRVMFQYPVGNFVDWSEIFDKMDNKSADLFALSKSSRPKFKRSLQDTVYAINRRIMECFNIERPAFKWRNNAIVRNF